MQGPLKDGVVTLIPTDSNSPRSSNNLRKGDNFYQLNLSKVGVVLAKNLGEVRSDRTDAKSSTLRVGHIERSGGHNLEEKSIKEMSKHEPGTVDSANKPETSEQEEGYTCDFVLNKAKSTE